jgi:hypothetical protein
MLRTRGDQDFVSQSTLAIDYTADLNLDKIDQLCLQMVYTDATPAVKTFVDADVSALNNTVTKASHGFTTGVKIALTTNGVLPAGLSATTYWLIVVDANTFKFATSLANALAGTAVDITAAAGGGTHTVTPASLSGTCKLQGSNDGTNFSDVKDKFGTAASTAISAAGNALWDMGNPGYRVLRVSYAVTAGVVALTVKLNGKSDAN